MLQGMVCVASGKMKLVLLVVLHAFANGSPYYRNPNSCTDNDFDQGLIHCVPGNMSLYTLDQRQAIGAYACDMEKGCVSYLLNKDAPGTFGNQAICLYDDTRVSLTHNTGWDAYTPN